MEPERPERVVRGMGMICFFFLYFSVKGEREREGGWGMVVFVGNNKVMLAGHLAGKGREKISLLRDDAVIEENENFLVVPILPVFF